MPFITIDGKKFEAKDGQTIIEVAIKNGVDIPHFCWHPELSVSGNCRMCLVEIGMPKRLPDGTFESDAEGKPVIGYFPKLQIACATPIADGMDVRASHPKVIEAQEAVMEFILINHPLDCPICDEAGECKLQDYAFRHSKAESRFDETKNHALKRQEWGPNVMYDAERCITCSRCIRFAQEVAHQDVLTFVQRGDHVTIKLFEGTTFDNPYSMNVIEICPVGALTSRDFRFKSRVWEMSFNDSISAHDSTGANIRIGVRNNEILRIEPRGNQKVNRYWLTDEARLDYKWVNENRITEPMIKENGNLRKAEWQEVYEFTAKSLSRFKPHEIMFIGSPKATNEDNYILNKFAKNVIKSNNVDFLKHFDSSTKEDGFLLVKDKAPNTSGLIELGLSSTGNSYPAEQLSDLINSGKIKALYVMEEDFAFHPNLIGALDKLELLIVHSYNMNEVSKKADVVIATSTYAESEGTFTNKDKRVQHFKPALVTKENLRIMGMKMSRLDKFGSKNDHWTQYEERNCRQSWRSITNIAKLMGTNWNYKNSEEIFDEIAQKVAGFKYMDYSKIDECGGLVLGKGDKLEPKIKEYVSHYYKP